MFRWLIVLLSMVIAGCSSSRIMVMPMIGAEEGISVDDEFYYVSVVDYGDDIQSAIAQAQRAAEIRLSRYLSNDNLYIAIAGGTILKADVRLEGTSYKAEVLLKAPRDANKKQWTQNPWKRECWQGF